MQYNKEELEKLILIENKSYEEIGRMYRVTGNAIKKAAKKFGIELPVRRKINVSEHFNKKERYCANCGKPLINYQKKYCSLECQKEHRNKELIDKWKSGEYSGTTAFTASSVVRNYMLKKAGYKCSICGWHEVNPYTGLVPLQLHHINGDSTDNREENLQVLCPNCHSLTENFGSRNKNAPEGKSAYYGKGSDSSVEQSNLLLRDRS